MSPYPTVPAVPLETVRQLVLHAQAVVAYLKQERQEAGLRGHDVAQTSGLIEGWNFMATALAESYDATDLLDQEALDAAWLPGAPLHARNAA